MKLPEPVRNFRFHRTRRFEIDFAWPEWRVGVEIDGGIRMPGGGAHSRPANIIRDMVKHNLLLDDGWRVWRFTPQQVQAGTAIQHIDAVLTALHRATAGTAATAQDGTLPPSVAPGYVPPSSPPSRLEMGFDDE